LKEIHTFIQQVCIKLVTVETFIMLKKFSISNKSSSFELYEQGPFEIFI